MALACAGLKLVPFLVPLRALVRSFAPPHGHHIGIHAPFPEEGGAAVSVYSHLARRVHGVPVARRAHPADVLVEVEEAGEALVQARRGLKRYLPLSHQAVARALERDTDGEAPALDGRATTERRRRMGRRVIMTRPPFQ